MLLTNTMHTVEEIVPRPSVWLHVVVLLANANGLGSLAAALWKCTGDGPSEGAEGRKGCSMLPWCSDRRLGAYGGLYIP